MPNLPPQRALPRRVGMSAIARHLGVSVMTVSYALRDHAKIPATTRRKVKQAAARLGYVPNPEISRLMHLLRDGRPSVQRCNIGVLNFTDRSAAQETTYRREFMAGAQRRAEQLGCVIDDVKLAIGQMSAKRTGQILQARGIRGVLVPPLQFPLDCSRLLDWSKFAVVAATYSAEGLLADRVVPHHFANCRLLFQKLIATGFRKIGVVVGDDLRPRFNDCHRATYAMLRAQGHLRPVPWLVDPSPAQFARWQRRYQPDVIVADSSMVLALRLGGDSRLVQFDVTEGEGRVGINQLPGEIGRSAVELLVGKITRGEFGLPRHPLVTMVEGVWRGW